jgi:WD40 repeat protein
MKHTINILLSSQETVYRVDALGLSSRSIESATKVAFKSLNLPSEQRSEQDDYLTTAAQAAYVSLNELDKAFKYRAVILLTSNTGVPISFEPQSVSASLGYSIVLALEWHKQRGKEHQVDTTVFATGHIHPSGNVTSIGHISTKVEAACKTAHSESLHDFVVYYPKDNQIDIPSDLREKVGQLNGRLVPIERLSDALYDLLGDAYDGLHLGRWEPFKGLDRFTYADRFRFFGRENDINNVVTVIENSNGVVVINGPSGAGKSSLIEAGVRPALESKGDLTYRRATPAELPVEELASWCAKQLGCGENDLVSGSDIEDTLTNATLWVFDQVEELFVNTEKETREQWFELLCGLADQLEKLTVIFCLRHEYVWRLNELTCFREHSHEEIKVFAQLKPNQWHDIIHKQAAYSGLTLESGLVDLIVDEAMRAGDNLPMVELVLTKLYENAENHVLSRSSFEEIGGLPGVIQQHAEQTLAKLTPSVIEKGLSQTFASLITVPIKDQDGLPILQFADITRITSPEVKDIIDVFYHARLIIKHPTVPNSYRFVHDVLMKDWTRVNDWLDQYRPFLKWLQRIEPQLNAWLEQPQKTRKQWLLRKGPMLKESLFWLKKEPLTVFPDLKQFIKDSNNSISTARVYGGAIVTCVILLFSTLGYMHFSKLEDIQRFDQVAAEADKAKIELEKQSKALEEQKLQVQIQTELAQTATGKVDVEQRQKLIEQSRYLSRVAKEENDKGNHDLALLLSLNALPGLYGGERPDVNEALDQLYISNHKQNKQARFYHAKPITNAAFSPDGTMIATVSEDKTTIIWSAETGKPIKTFIHESVPTLVEFNPNGKSLVTYEVPPETSNSSPSPPHLNMSIWSLDTGERIQFAHRRVNDIMFNPNGASFLLIGSTTVLYSNETGQPIGPDSSRGYKSLGAFNKTGSNVLLAKDNFATLYSTSNMQPKNQLGLNPRDAMFSLDIAPHASHFLVSGRNEVVVKSIIINKVTSRLPTSSYARFAKFTPDGRNIITIGVNQVIKRWSLGRNAKIELQAQLKNAPISMEYVQKGQYIVLVDAIGDTVTLLNTSTLEVVKEWKFSDEIKFFKMSEDNTSFIVSTVGSEEIYSYSFRPHEGLFSLGEISKGYSVRSNHAVFTSEGHIVTASSDKKARTWSDKGKVLKTFPHEFTLKHVDELLNKNLIVTTGENTSTLWNTETLEKINSFTYDDYLSQSYLGRHGNVIASIHQNTVLIWSAKSGDLLSKSTFDGEIEQMAFNSDDTSIFVRFERGKSIEQVDVYSGKKIFSFTAPSKINHFDYNVTKDEIVIASYSKNVRLWSVQKKQKLHEFIHGSADVQFVKFSPNFDRLVTLTQDSIKVWSDSNYSMLNNIAAPYPVRFQLAELSEDGRKLFTLSNHGDMWRGSKNQRISWSLLSNTELTRVERRNSYTGNDDNNRMYMDLKSAGLFNDGKQHYENNGMVSIWRSIDTNISVVDAAKSLPLNRSCLTPQERRRFLLPKLTEQQRKERGCAQMVR